MEKMQDFIEGILNISKKYKNENESDGINIFKVLFKGHEEVELHSRFISFLLSTQKEFLNIFIDMLKAKDPKLNFDIEGSVVRPNVANKTEYEEIDILIVNEEKGQAIIIENKIHANDSIDESASEVYKGQLDRYFNTIVKQKDKNGNLCKYKCDKDKTFVFYLSLYKKPSKETYRHLKSIGKFDPENHCIGYHDFIQDWLKKCILIEKDESLKGIIEKYKKFIAKMTNDNKLALEFTDFIAENDNWESAWRYHDNFKHVKWHTIHRFFSELKIKFDGSVDVFPSENDIANVAHKGIAKDLIINFHINDNELYICFDKKKKFSIRNNSDKRWDYFIKEEINNINFCDFSNKETFALINAQKRKEIIDEMYDEVKNKYDKLSKRIEK